MILLQTMTKGPTNTPPMTVGGWFAQALAEAKQTRARLATLESASEA